MPGFAGLVDFHGTNPITDRLAMLLEPLRSDEKDITTTASTRWCGMGRVDWREESAATLVSKGNITLAWLGYIATGDLLASRLNSIPDINMSQPTGGLLIDLYRHSGTQALHGLNGQYAIILWDEDRRTLKVINDRYGMQPLYYWQYGTQLAFSTTLRAIARHPDFHREINPVALFDLLATGQMLGERTLFKEVLALPPAAELTFARGQLTLTQYWQPSLRQPGGAAPSAAECVEQYASLIQAAVRRHTIPESCLLLTGGVDSRWLAGTMAALYNGTCLTASTIGHDRARDTRIARRVASASGLPHHMIDVNPRYLEEYSTEVVRRTDGNMNITAGWILGESDFLRSHAIQQVVTGINGELISGGYWLARHPEIEPNLAIHELCTQHWHFDRAIKLMQPPYQQESYRSSLELVKRAVRAAPSSEPASQYDYLYITQDRRHPSGNILADDAAVREPLFDNDLVDFALCLPPKMRAYAYKKALVENFPRLAALESTDGGVSIADHVTGKRSRTEKAEQYLFHALRKLRLATVVGLPGGDHPSSTIYPNHWMRTVSRPFIIAELQNLDLLEPYINREAVQVLWEDHLAGRVNACGQLGALLTAVIWAKDIV